MICIEFGNNGISVLSAQEQKGNILVQQFAKTKLDRAIYENGIILNMAQCTEVINDFLRDQGFREKNVGILLHVPAISRELSLPYTLNPKHMNTLVQSEIAAVYTAKEEYLLQYAILSLVQVENHSIAKIMAYLMPRLIVESYQHLLKIMKKKPVFFDVAQNALLKAARMQPALTEAGPYITVKLTPEDVAVHLLDGKGSILTRTAQIGKKNSDMPALGIDLLSGGGQEVCQEEAQLEATYDMAAQQIYKMLQFYSIKSPGSFLNRVYLCGDIEKPAEACMRLQMELEVEVAMLPNPPSVFSPAGFNFYNWVTLIGAMLRK